MINDHGSSKQRLIGARPAVVWPYACPCRCCGWDRRDVSLFPLACCRAQCLQIAIPKALQWKCMQDEPPPTVTLAPKKHVHRPDRSDRCMVHGTCVEIKRTFRSPISRSMAASISCSERLGTSGRSPAGAEVVASAGPSAGPDPKSVSKCASLQRSSPPCRALHTSYRLFTLSTPADNFEKILHLLR